MDKRLHMLASCNARGDDGGLHAVRGHEHLARPKVTMRIEWRWLLVGALGIAVMRWALQRARRPMQEAREDEASAYCDELERMQDA